MSVSPSVPIFMWLFALGILGLTAPASRADEKVGPSPAVVKKADLRYDGKPFSYWRTYWRTELKAERRIDFARAMGAFGANGYGEEAATAIMELVKSYSLDDVVYANRGPIPGLTADQEVALEAHRAILKIGPPAAAVLLRSLDSKAQRTFAENLLSRLTIPPEDVRTLVELVQPATDEVALLAMRVLGEHMPELRRHLLEATAQQNINERFVAVLAKRLKGGSQEDVYRATLLLRQLGAKARAAVPAILERLRQVEKLRHGVNNFEQGDLVRSEVDLVKALGEIGPVAQPALPTLRQLRSYAPTLLDDAIMSAIRQISGEVKAPAKGDKEKY